MNRTRSLFLRLACLLASFALFVVGVSLVSPPDQPAASFATPAIVDDSLLPPHREPPPPPPPPPPPEPIVGVLQDVVLGALRASGASAISGEVSIAGIGRAFELNSGSQGSPASTQKIYTASAALNLLGPEYAFETRLLRVGNILPDGVLQGDLILVGGGDPSLTKENLGALAQQVAGVGVRSIQGNLIGDDTRFDRVRVAPGWKPDFVTHEIGALSAIAVDQNDYRNDPEFIADPVSPNLEKMREALAGAGVSVAGSVALGSVPESAEFVASHRSAPLRDLLVPTLRESDNFFAEMIVKELGRRIGDASTAGGITAISNFARSRNLPFGSSVDGSGLSSLNKQSTSEQVQWLRAINSSSHAGAFRSALAVSCGSDGTLRKRMCGSSAAGRVWAKSGGLEDVATLAGYTTTASGRTVTFSFMLLGSTSGKEARNAIDAALAAVASYPG